MRGCWRSTPSFRSKPSRCSSDARGDEARKAAAARVRADVGKHVKDIAERYLLAGETQDIALMFVPSGVRSIPISSSISTTSCKRRIAPGSSSSRRRC